MNREKFAWLLSMALIALLAFQMPRSLAHRDDDYNFARTLIDIHRQVSVNYVEQPDEQKLEQGAINGMLGTLDPFTTYVPPANQEQFDNMLEGSFKGVGIQLDQNEKGDVEVITPIDNSPAARAGVWAGDIILKVNGDDIKNLKLQEVMKHVKGPTGTPVTLTVRHDDGTIQDLTMNRDDIVVPTVKGYRRHPYSRAAEVDGWDYWISQHPKIAYVRITQFTADTGADLKKVMQRLVGQQMQGLILDLRFNPGGRLDQAKDVVNLFVDHGVIVKVKGRNRPEEITQAKKEAALAKFPMIVLVNEHSASASEIVAGSLKDNERALIVGGRTYGKGSVQELIPLEGNAGELKLTVAYYYLPSGRLVHKKPASTDWGVDPQLAVAMDSEQEKHLIQEQMALDLIHGPATRPASAPTATASTTAPATQPSPDPQLAAGLDAVLVDIQSGKNADVPNVPATRPSH